MFMVFAFIEDVYTPDRRIIPQVLALKGSYGVAFREGPWTGGRCGDAAAEHSFIFTIQNQCHPQKLIFSKKLMAH